MYMASLTPTSEDRRTPVLSLRSFAWEMAGTSDICSADARTEGMATSVATTPVRMPYSERA